MHSSRVIPNKHEYQPSKEQLPGTAFFQKLLRLGFLLKCYDSLATNAFLLFRISSTLCITKSRKDKIGSWYDASVYKIRDINLKLSLNS